MTAIDVTRVAGQDGDVLIEEHCHERLEVDVVGPQRRAVGTYAVGTRPFGLAFDGTHIWVANGSGNSVTKLRASDGAAVGTYAVGGGPAAIAFDGTFIWVANFDGNSVTKLQASDGSLMGTYTVGVNPYGIAFDGTHIWTANESSNTVSKR